MPMTLICLLSAQQIPNLLSIFHFRPERLLLLETDKAKTDGLAPALIEAARRGGLDYGDASDIAMVAREDSLLSVHDALRPHRDGFGDAILNATGGTKPMSMAAYDFCKKNKISKTVYINAAKPNEIIDYLPSDESVIERCTHPLSVDQFVTAQGATPVENSALLSRPVEQQKQLIQMISQWGDGLSPLYKTEGMEFVANVKDLPFEKQRLNDAVQPHIMDRQQKTRLLDMLTRHFSSGLLTGSDVAILNGEWLTLLIAELLREHSAALGITDVRHQYKFQVGTKIQEIDVAFVRNYRLFIVECKSGLQRSASQEGHLERLVGMREKFGRLGADAILVTCARTVFQQDGKTLKQEISDHAAALQCKIWTYPAVRELSHEGVGERVVVSLLKSLLDSTS